MMTVQMMMIIALRTNNLWIFLSSNKKSIKSWPVCSYSSIHCAHNLLTNPTIKWSQLHGWSTPWWWPIWLIWYTNLPDLAPLASNLPCSILQHALSLFACWIELIPNLQSPACWPAPLHRQPLLADHAAKTSTNPQPQSTQTYHAFLLPVLPHDHQLTMFPWITYCLPMCYLCSLTAHQTTIQLAVQFIHPQNSPYPLSAQQAMIPSLQRFDMACLLHMLIPSLPFSPSLSSISQPPFLPQLLALMAHTTCNHPNMCSTIQWYTWLSTQFANCPEQSCCHSAQNSITPLVVICVFFCPKCESLPSCSMGAFPPLSCRVSKVKRQHYKPMFFPLIQQYYHFIVMNNKTRMAKKQYT